jgi:hypothetical protein
MFYLLGLAQGFSPARNSANTRGFSPGPSFRRSACNHFQHPLPKLSQRNRLSRYRARLAFPPFSAVRPIAERPLRRHAATAKRDRRLARQVPLVPIHVDQSDRALNAKWPIRTNRNLHCRRRCRLYRRYIQYFVRHKTPLVFAHWKTSLDKARIANKGVYLRKARLHQLPPHRCSTSPSFPPARSIA